MKLFRTLLFIVLTFAVEGCNSHCGLVDKVKKVAMDGIVEKKYIIERDKNTRVLSVKNHRDIYLRSEVSGFWEYVQEGDSVSKDSNTYIVHVFRADSTKSFELKYLGCN